MGLLDGKVALITGAGGGLGRAYAILLASEGASVVVNDLGGGTDGVGSGNAMADQVVNEIKAAGGQALANYSSVSETSGAQSMVDDAIENFGRLDIVVNNAGILRDKTLHKLSDENFDIVMAVHARGTFLVTRIATEAMAKLGNGGSIINTSSIAGLKGNFGQTNYACAKAGIAGMTRVWSQELTRYNIRTNAVAPMAKTRMTEDISAVPDIKPEEIAPMVLFLASDLSKDVNGRIFGCHGAHVFEYHMMLSPGVEAEGWTAQSIAERLDEISSLPSTESESTDTSDSGGDDPAAIVDQVFARMPDVFMPEKAGDWSTVIHFDIGGEMSYTVRVQDGQFTTEKGRPNDQKCTITYDSVDTILDAVTGKINPQQAFMAGKIKADNMGELMKFVACVDMRKGAAMAEARKNKPAEMSTEDKVAEVFKRMPEAFLPEKAGDWSSVIHFNVVGTGSYGIHIENGSCTSSVGEPAEKRCTITYDGAATLLGMITGEVNAQQAFMAGKIKADNMGELMKFAGSFDMKAGARKAKEAAEAGGETAAPVHDGMNRELIGRSYRDGAAFVYPQHAEAFAQATNDLNPAYMDSNDPIAPVLLPVRALMGVVGQAVMDRSLNADLMRLVHGEQDMRFYDVIRPWDLLAGRASIDDIEVKSSGELLKVRQRLMRDGDPVCEVVSGYFVRAKTKGGGEAKAKEEPPVRDYIFTETVTIDDDQSYRYAEISLDKNPIHVDDAAATAAGHPGVILHGLCTMAVSGAAIINQACGGNPARLARLKVRFTRIVLPGDTLRVRAWNEGEDDGRQVLGFETINQRDEVVIGNALAEIRPA